MKNNNNTPATVPAVLAAFVELSNRNRVDASASYVIACQAAGAQSAILDKLAEALGGFWMFGADMVEYRAEIVAAVETIKANADEAAKIGDCIDNNYYINNMDESVARVMHFADKTDNHTEPAATEEESNATEEESNDAPAAGSLDQLRQEREEVAELLRISEGTVAILTPRLEAAKAEARAAAGRNDRQAWSDAESRALEISYRLDEARNYVDMDRENLEYIDHRIAYLEGLEDSKVEPLAEVVAAVDWAVEDCVFCNSDEFRALPESVQVFWHDCRYEELARNINATEYANAFDAFFDCVANDLAIQQGEQWAATYDLDTVAKSLRLAFAKHFAA